MSKNPDKRRTMQIAAVVAVATLLVASVGYYLYESENEEEFKKNMRIMPGEFSFVKVSGDKGSGMPEPLPPFPKNVKSAINRVPNWLRGDLEKKFVELSQKGIRVDGRGSPYLVDFDGDGDCDLLAGTSDGHVFFKENTGSAYAPIFTPRDLTDPISVDSNSAPAAVDLNGDGNTDLVVGRQDGTLAYYRNKGSNSNPVWEEDNSMFAGIDAGSNSRPVFVDYDKDGDYDLIVSGNTNHVTRLYYYENSGTLEGPNWTIHPEEFALLEPEILDYPFPAVADMDNDGDFDLTLGGRDGRLRYFENTGDVYATVWREQASVYLDIRVDAMACPTFADINGDSRPDLIVGDNNGTFFSFPNHGTPEHPQFVGLSTGTIYCSGSAGEEASDVIRDVRAQVMGPGTLNIDRMLKEYYEHDISIFANEINRAPKKCVDELGFIIAHTNEDVLRAMTGTIDLHDPEVDYRPDILLRDVEELYNLKGKLKYADIVEKGDYTTIRYTNGDGEKKELPRDVYYWYVVHPRCRFEVPGYTHSDFWREYLRYNDEYGESLVDAVKDAKNMSEAVYALTNWMTGFMDFGYDTHDKTPIEIYDVHYGSCGEYSILTNAFGRAVFIPTRLANDWGEDHVWNEFYDDVSNGTWHHWDTTGPHIYDPEVYERDWHKDISTIWSIRGDDFIYEYGVTEKYTGTAHITVIVHDRNGEPVDGACVVMESEYFMRNHPDYWQTPTISIWNYTNLDGQCEFDLGGNYYTIDVMSEIGNFHRGYPDMEEWSPLGSYHVVEGEDDTLILTIDGEMPGMPETSVLNREGKGTKVKLTLKDVHVAAQSILTYPDDTVVITGNRYPQSIQGGMEVFVCDENNFQRFLKGYDFDCVERLHVTEEKDFDVPGGEWYVIMCNRYSLGTEFEVEVSVG